MIKLNQLKLYIDKLTFPKIVHKYWVLIIMRKLKQNKHLLNNNLMNYQNYMMR